MKTIRSIFFFLNNFFLYLMLPPLCLSLGARRPLSYHFLSSGVYCMNVALSAALKVRKGLCMKESATEENPVSFFQHDADAGSKVGTLQPCAAAVGIDIL
ncbi:hypothetical protein F5Y08DRAFT_296484, partial [Xylaria arbuscula]